MKPAFALLLVALPLFGDVDLAITGANSLRVDPGQKIRLAYSMTNRGSDSTTATVTITLPAGTELRGSLEPWQCVAAAPGVVCTSTMAAHAFSQLYVDITAPPTRDGLRAPLIATISSPQDSNPANDRSQDTLIVYRYFEVDSSADAGPGTLREAIIASNQRCDSFDCHIRFASPMTVEPLTPLPPLTGRNLLLDAWETRTDNPEGDVHIPRRVTLSGAKLKEGNGLEIAGPDPGIYVDGFAIGGFPGNGMRVTGDARIESCFIGTDASGEEARPNGLRGVSIEDSRAGVQLRHDVISGNGRSGVSVWAGGRIEIDRSLIGISPTNRPLGNGGSGVFAAGGALLMNNNTIAYNREFGAAFARSVLRASSTNDAIYLNGSGTAIDWGLDGPNGSDNDPNVPPRPVLTEAFWDPAKQRTIVRGFVPGLRFAAYTVELQVTAPGRRDAWASLAPYGSFRPLGDGLEFEIRLDLRPYAITATSSWPTNFEDDQTNTSEYAEAIPVR